MNVYTKEFKSDEMADVIGFLEQDDRFNGLFIGDLKETDLLPDQIRVIGEMENEVIKALMLFYKDKMVYTSMVDRDISLFVNIIKESGITKFVGRKDAIEKFKTYFQPEFESDSYIMCMDSITMNCHTNTKVIKRVHTQDELHKLYSLLNQVEEYSYIGNDPEKFVNQQMSLLESNQSRTYYLEENGEMVSTAATLGEKEKSALLVGVATPPSHRNKGYASKVVLQLCTDLIEEGKRVYLFYNNSDAGSIYRRIGFQDLGEWKVMGIKQS